jgi:hypothetical protein
VRRLRTLLRDRVILVCRADVDAANAQAEAKDCETSQRTLVSGLIEDWDASAPFPLASVRSSLGQTGCLAAETKVLVCSTPVGFAYTSLHGYDCLWSAGQTGCLAATMTVALISFPPGLRYCFCPWRFPPCQSCHLASPGPISWLAGQ